MRWDAKLKALKGTHDTRAKPCHAYYRSNVVTAVELEDGQIDDGQKVHKLKYCLHGSLPADVHRLAEWQRDGLNVGGRVVRCMLTERCQRSCSAALAPYDAHQCTSSGTT